MAEVPAFLRRWCSNYLQYASWGSTIEGRDLVDALPHIVSEVSGMDVPCAVFRRSMPPTSRGWKRLYDFLLAEAVRRAPTSSSATAAVARAGGDPTRASDGGYKCRFWATGNCYHGEKCAFSHEGPAGKGKGKGSGKGAPGPDSRCFRCNGVGHFVAQCTAAAPIKPVHPQRTNAMLAAAGQAAAQPSQGNHASQNTNQESGDKDPRMC